MIYDKIENICFYQLPEEFIKAFEAFKNAEFPSRSELNDGIIGMAQQYATKTEGAKFESHRRYVDFQYVLSGSEKVGLTLDSQPSGEYDEIKDLILYKDEPKNFINLCAGEFCIFFPQDLHMPALGNGNTVKKFVFKIPVELMK